MVNISKIRGQEDESLGAFLKHQRELRGISLEEIAKHSLIRLEFLKAIEQEKFVQLPGIAFAKGYLRAYANYIGLDAEDVLLRFESRYASLNRSDSKSNRVSWASIFMGLAATLAFAALIYWLVKK